MTYTLQEEIKVQTTKAVKLGALDASEGKGTKQASLTCLEGTEATKTQRWLTASKNPARHAQLMA